MYRIFRSVVVVVILIFSLLVNAPTIEGFAFDAIWLRHVGDAAKFGGHATSLIVLPLPHLDVVCIIIRRA
jgi:hypothetical protein